MSGSSDDDYSEAQMDADILASIMKNKPVPKKSVKSSQQRGNVQSEGRPKRMLKPTAKALEFGETIKQSVTSEFYIYCHV